MDSIYFWLVVAELIIIALIVIIKLIFSYFENKKINGILNFFEKRAKEKDIEDKYKQCLEIIRKNKKEE